MLRNTFAFFLVLTSIANLLLVILRVSNHSGVSNTHTWLGHDFPEFLPLHTSEPDLVHMRVEESRQYDSYKNDSDMRWYSLSTSGRGYTHLGPEYRLFMVTMYHELHCMRFLSRALGGEVNVGHVHHCLNYLRQTTLCSSDLTLEPGDFTERNFETDRGGALHTCRDWNAAYEMMDERWEHWLGRHRNST
ncbi:hypothetical protein DXG01_013293 [Tephrocybe rancida]|nr:hypothetical protein DXG01_013293 [Tephrocybe rancida]